MSSELYSASPPHHRSPTTTPAASHSSTSKNGNATTTIIRRRRRSTDEGGKTKEEVKEIQMKTLSSSGGAGGGGKRNKERRSSSGSKHRHHHHHRQHAKKAPYQYTDPNEPVSLTMLLQEHKQKLQKVKQEQQQSSQPPRSQESGGSKSRSRFAKRKGSGGRRSSSSHKKHRRHHHHHGGRHSRHDRGTSASASESVSRSSTFYTDEDTATRGTEETPVTSSGSTSGLPSYGTLSTGYTPGVSSQGAASRSQAFKGKGGGRRRSSEVSESQESMTITHARGRPAPKKAAATAGRRPQANGDAFSPTSVTSSCCSSCSPCSSPTYNASSSSAGRGAKKGKGANASRGGAGRDGGLPEEIQWSIQYHPPSAARGGEEDGASALDSSQSFTSHGSDRGPSSTSLPPPGGSRTTTATMTLRLTPTPLSRKAVEEAEEEEGYRTVITKKKAPSSSSSTAKPEATRRGEKDRFSGSNRKREASSGSKDPCRHCHHHHHPHRHSHQGSSSPHRSSGSRGRRHSSSSAPVTSTTITTSVPSSPKSNVYADLLSNEAAASITAAPPSSTSKNKKSKKTPETSASYSPHRHRRGSSCSSCGHHHHHHHHHHHSSLSSCEEDEVNRLTEPPRRGSSITVAIRRKVGGEDTRVGGQSSESNSKAERSKKTKKNPKGSGGARQRRARRADEEEEADEEVEEVEVEVEISGSGSLRRGEERRPPSHSQSRRRHHHHHHHHHRPSLDGETTITFSKTEGITPSRLPVPAASSSRCEEQGGVTTIVISKQQQEKRQKEHSRHSRSRSASRTSPPSPMTCLPSSGILPGIQGQYVHDVDPEAANKQKLHNLKVKAACLAHEDYIYELHAPSWAEAQQQKLAAAHDKASNMLAALEKGNKWLVTEPFELNRLMRLCSLELSFQELVKPGDKPKYLEIIALRKALTELKQHPKKTVGVSLGGTIDNALSKVESTEEELRRSQCNAVALGRVALPVVKGLEDCLNAPSVDRSLQANEDRIAAQLDAIKASSKLRDAALADGEMGIAEEQYYVKGQLLERLLELINDKFRIIGDHESMNASMENMKSTRQRALEELASIRASNHRLRERCESDMKNLMKAVETADVADAEAAQGYLGKRDESEQVLAVNLQKQFDIWKKIQEMEYALQRLGAERLEEVKRRIDAHDREEKRHVEYQQFLDVCDQHKKVLETTMYNCEVGNRCVALIEKMVSDTCKNVQSRNDKASEELADLRMQVHIEYLEAFRRLYKTLGQLLYKKEKRIEEIDRQLRTTHIQLEFAIETFDPNAKKHSDTKKELHELRAHVEGEIEMLKEKIAQALESFIPTEEALNQAGIKYKHPVDEVEDINLSRRSKMVEYRAHLAKQEEDRIKAEREEIRRAKKLQEEQQRQRSVLQITQN